MPWNPDAPFHPVDLADVAEVVGQVVADPDAHAGASYELAGPQRLSVREMVERAGQATGQRLQVEELPSTQVPLPPALTRTEVAERMAMFAKYDRGYPCSPNVLRFLLGREPTSLEDTARREFNPGPG